MIQRTLFGLLLAYLVAQPLAADSDSIKSAVRDLKNKKYGAYWDRLKACKALGSENNAEAARALAIALVDADLAVREAAVMAYAKMDDEGARGVITGELLLKGRDPRIRSGAAWALRMSKEAKGAEAGLARALGDRSGQVRAQAARAIAALEISSAGKALVKSLKDSDYNAAAEKLRAVSQLKPEGAKDAVQKMTKGGHPVTRAEALQALAALDAKALVPLIAAATKDAKAEARMGLLYALKLLPADDAFEAGAKLVSDKDWRVRTVAIELLAKIREKRCIGPMVTQMAKEKGRLRFDFAVALGQMTGMDLGYDGKAWASWWKAAEKGFRMPEAGKKKGKEKKDGSVATFFGIPILSDAVAFAIDFSGSMKNNISKGKYKGKVKIKTAFEQLEQALNRFQKNQRFSVIHVSTEATAQKKRLLMPRLVPATRRNKYTAMVSIKKIWKTLEPIKRGRGDFYDALLEGGNKLRADTILLLSDGNPSFGMYILNENFLPEWARFNKYRRIMLHAILIGGSSRSSRELCEELAKQTGGIYQDLTSDGRSSKKRPRRRKKK